MQSRIREVTERTMVRHACRAISLSGCGTKFAAHHRWQSINFRVAGHRVSGDTRRRPPVRLRRRPLGRSVVWRGCPGPRSSDSPVGRGAAPHHHRRHRREPTSLLAVKGKQASHRSRHIRRFRTASPSTGFRAVPAARSARCRAALTHQLDLEFPQFAVSPIWASRRSIHLYSTTAA